MRNKNIVGKCFRQFGEGTDVEIVCQGVVLSKEGIDDRFDCKFIDSNGIKPDETRSVQRSEMVHWFFFDSEAELLADYNRRIAERKSKEQ